jgi:hypothetical protein
VVLPYAVLPGGMAMAWAGAVQLPLELAARRAPEGDRLLPQVGDLLPTNVADLPIWLLAAVPAFGLLCIFSRQWRQPLQQVERVLWLPALGLVFLLELLLTMQLGSFEKGDLQQVVLPLLLIMACGFGDLEARPAPIRRIARVAVVVILLIFLNNTFVASLLNAPRRPRAPMQTVEADRTAARGYLAGRQRIAASPLPRTWPCSANCGNWPQRSASAPNGASMEPQPAGADGQLGHPPAWPAHDQRGRLPPAHRSGQPPPGLDAHRPGRSQHGGLPAQLPRATA